MRPEIVEKIRRAMAATGVEAAVLSSPQNFTYVTGFVVPSHALFPWRLTMALVPAQGEPAIVVVDMEASTVRRRAPPGTELRVWGEFTGDPMRELGGLLSDMGLAAARIGVEDDHLPYADLVRLKAGLPDATFVPVQAAVAKQRQRKTAEEIALLRRLSRIADRAILEAYAAVGAGSSEMDIAAALTRGVYAQGAEEFKLMIVATGPRSQLPNVGPSERRLEAGDVCRVEIFPVIGGYHAGVCRTAAVGTPPPHAETIWAKLVECKHLVLEMTKPGASGRAIYDAFTARLKALELPPIGFVGHGIGVHLHEDPYLGIGMDATLEPGMVLGVEPLCYETGHGFGMQNKDMLLVTDNGCELLSDVADTERLIAVR